MTRVPVPLYKFIVFLYTIEFSCVSLKGDLSGLYINMKNRYCWIVGSDIPSNEDKDIISKKDGVPEQAQRITGPGTLTGFVKLINI